MQRCAQNGMDLTEAEDIKQRMQEFTEELYKAKKAEKKDEAAAGENK